MVTNEELQGYRRDRYFARSWALLTGDSGWVKVVVLLALASLVPIVGLLGVIGYVYEWGRVIAWNINSSPKQHDVKIGKCIKSGWRVFLVMLVWGLCLGLIAGVLAIIPLIGTVLFVVFIIFIYLFAIGIQAAALSATIYQKISAGFKVSRIWQMWSHDIGGAVRVMLVNLVGSLCTSVVSSIALLPLMYSDSAAAYILSAVLGFVALTISMAVELLYVAASALWMRQFNVPEWGSPDDPLPAFVNDPREYGEPYPHNTRPNDYGHDPYDGNPGTARAPYEDPYNAKSTFDHDSGEVKADVVKEWSVDDDSNDENDEQNESPFSS